MKKVKKGKVKKITNDLTRNYFDKKFKEDFRIMRAEIGEIKKVIKEKLGVEISLI